MSRMSDPLTSAIDVPCEETPLLRRDGAAGGTTAQSDSGGGTTAGGVAYGGSDYTTPSPSLLPTNGDVDVVEEPAERSRTARARDWLNIQDDHSTVMSMASEDIFSDNSMSVTSGRTRRPRRHDGRRTMKKARQVRTQTASLHSLPGYRTERSFMFDHQEEMEPEEWNRCISRRAYENLSFLLWMLAMSSFAALLVFLTPSLFWPNSDTLGINISPMVLNILGSFVISICTSFSRIKYQYFQTYMMYTAISSGFCSAFTTYGNLVADTGRLLLVGRWGLSVVNLLANILLSIVAYQIGTWIAARWKRGVGYSDEVVRLRNAQHRMGFELDKQFAEKDPVEWVEGDEDPHYRSRFRDSSLSKFEDHVKEQLEKKKLHQTTSFTMRHMLIVYLMLLTVVVGYATFIFLDFTDLRSDLPTWFPVAVDPHLVFDYTVTIVFSFSGALIGGWVGDKYNMNDKVQWGTFRVNLISCVFIAMAHNVAMFKGYIPGAETSYFNVILYRFVVNFCGSESSFAGLINETMILWNGKTRVRRVNALWNMFFGLIVCLAVFFMLVLSVRIGVFFRYWSPQTAELYLCSGGFFFTC